MFRRVVFAAGLLVSWAAIASAQTADEVVAKTIAAQGGADKIKAVQTMRMTGTMSLGPGMEVPIVIEAKRPKKVRVDLDVQGTQNTQAYDGQTGWVFLPVQNMKTPEPAPADMMKDLDEQADMDGPLVDYKDKGNQVELMGKEAVQGTDTYKLKVTTKAGEVRYVYIDTEHFLPLKAESKRMVNGAERATSTLMGDYKAEGGVMMPHSIESTVEGAPATQKVTITKIDINVPIDDARFKMPAAK